MTETHELPHGDVEYITEAARGIVTHQLLVADLSKREWQASLALHVEALAQVSNLGVILVPFAAHAHLYWINNTAPGITMQCQLVAAEDLDALSAEVDRMHTALHPNDPQPKEHTMNVNGVYAEPGVVVDGDVHGDYSEDRLADIAIAYGFELDDDHDPRVWRAKLVESEEQGDGMEDNHRASLEDAGIKLIELMNLRAEDCHFEWEDGSVFLVSDEDESPPSIDPRLIDPSEDS